MKQWYNRIWQTFVMYKITDKMLSANKSKYNSKLESIWFSVLSFIHDNGIVASHTLDKEFLYF